jgi:hypothetical protein
MSRRCKLVSLLDDQVSVVLFVYVAVVWQLEVK